MNTCYLIKVICFHLMVHIHDIATLIFVVTSTWKQQLYHLYTPVMLRKLQVCRDSIFSSNSFEFVPDSNVVEACSTAMRHERLKRRTSGNRSRQDLGNPIRLTEVEAALYNPLPVRGSCDNVTRHSSRAGVIYLECHAIEAA